jgi:ketosteroid isomerase-like protein
VEPLSLTVEGDRAVYRWRTKVTFTPNGRSEVMDVMDLIELEDGQIRSVEEFTDTAGVMRLTAS